MPWERDPCEGPPRVLEGGLSLSPPPRGRFTAPHLSTQVRIWLPIAAKVAAAAIGAVVLAVIGAKSGAHAPPRAVEPPPSASAPPPPVVAAAFVMGLSAAAPTEDGGTHEAPPLAEPLPPSGAPSNDGSGLLADGRIVLNEASENELTKLPGIGPSRARAILALRQRLTRFKAVEDLLRVKGIGRKMLRRLRPSVVLDRPAANPRAPPASAEPREGGDPPEVAP
ncbi:MAG: helix-hairpin-helix domain-containing protein [Polyangiaceae bacterium]